MRFPLGDVAHRVQSLEYILFDLRAFLPPVESTHEPNLHRFGDGLQHLKRGCYKAITVDYGVILTLFSLWPFLSLFKMRQSSLVADLERAKGIEAVYTHHELETIRRAVSAIPRLPKNDERAAVAFPEICANRDGVSASIADRLLEFVRQHEIVADDRDFHHSGFRRH
jgi:hypothetical protein